MAHVRKHMVGEWQPNQPSRLVILYPLVTLGFLFFVPLIVCRICFGCCFPLPLFSPDKHLLSLTSFPVCGKRRVCVKHPVSLRSIYPSYLRSDSRLQWGCFRENSLFRTRWGTSIVFSIVISWLKSISVSLLQCFFRAAVCLFNLLLLFDKKWLNFEYH